jgi:arginine N-succinyltransferase
MFVIRPIKQDDLEGLLELLSGAGHGLTSLPKDPQILKRRIKHSEISFDHEAWPDGPSGQSYLFVMEELYTGRIVGVSGIIAKIGGFEPYYFYRLEENTHNSEMLNVKNDIRSLHLEAVHSGPAEICSLYLAKDFRNSQNGRFLSLSRFLFMADNEKYFEKEVIAELRGQVDDTGHSPFWDAVGKHFFQIDFPTADYLTMKSKKFIEELLPKYPIVVNLLSEAAQEVVAEVHPNTAPARRILEQEGFEFSGLVGVFEPGPVIKAPLDKVRTIKESKHMEIKSVKPASDIEGEPHIISTTQGKFRACLSPISVEDNGLTISDVAATALKVKIGEVVRFVSLRPKNQAQRKMTSKKKV